MNASVKSWWEAMRNRKAKTRATLANIVYDWRQRRVPPNVVHELLADVGAAWETSPANAKPEEVLREVVNKNPGKYLLKGPPVDACTVECSRVMTAEDLLLYNLDPSKVMFEAKNGLTRGHMEDLERKGIGTAAIGKMATLRPIAWITRRDALEDVAARDLSHAANRVRDALGLESLREDEHLVEIRYPPSALQNAVVTSPTFIEGCPSLIYRSRHCEDGWGRTVNLVGLQDGLPEAVHHEVPFTSEFSVHYLGPLQPPTPSLNWEEFLKELPVRWDEVDPDELEDA